MEPFKINVHKISMADYEQHHYEKQLLKESGIHTFLFPSYKFLKIFFCVCSAVDCNFKTFIHFYVSEFRAKTIVANL